MKQFAIIMIVCVLILSLMIGCGKKDDLVKLEKDSSAYNTAVEMAMKVPSLDPEANEVLAQSRDFKITSGEVVGFLHDNMGKTASQMADLQESRIKQEIGRILEQMCERRLLYQYTSQAGVTVSDAEIDSMLENQYTHPKFGSKEKFEAWAKESEISIDFIRKDFGEILLIQKGLDELLSDQVEVTDEDIQKAYSEPKTVSVRHILLMTQGKPEEEKQAIYEKMQGILERAKSGEDFEKLAKEYTEDPGSKNTGGLYEDFGRGRMVPPFEEASFTVPVGEISDIVETRYGYHILKVVGRKSETKPLDEVKDTLKQQLAQQKKTTSYQDLISRLKEESELEILFE